MIAVCQDRYLLFKTLLVFIFPVRLRYIVKRKDFNDYYINGEITNYDKIHSFLVKHIPFSINKLGLNKLG